MFPLVLSHRIPKYFLDFRKQLKQNTCNIQFIESFYLKDRINKPREVKNYIKNLRVQLEIDCIFDIIKTFYV